MSIRDELSSALEELEVEISDGGKVNTFLWRYVRDSEGNIQGGYQVPCMPGDSAIGAVLGMGPVEPEESMLIKVRKNAFTTKTGDSAIGPTGDSDSQDDSGDDNLIEPKPGHFLFFEQKEWEIERVKPDAAGAYWLIYCVSPDS